MKKILLYRRNPGQSIPLNAILSERELSKKCSILPWDCQLTARIDGIDGSFLFGNAQFSQFATGVQHLPLAFGDLAGG